MGKTKVEYREESDDRLMMLLSTAMATYDGDDEAEHLIRTLRAAGYQIIKSE